MSAQRRLVGDALTWYESLIPSPSTYQEFRQIFYQHFWSHSAQRKARNHVFRPYRYDRPNGLANHAMQWISSAKYLSPPIDQLDLVSTIIQHYPTPLGMAIRGRGPRTTNELLFILTEFEDSASFCESSRNNNQHGNQPRNSSQENQRHGNSRFPPRQTVSTNHDSQHINQIDISGNKEAPRS